MDLKSLLAKHDSGGGSKPDAHESGEHEGGSLGPLAKKLGVSEELLTESLRAFMRDEHEHSEPDDDDKPDYRGPKSLKSLLS